MSDAVLAQGSAGRPPEDVPDGKTYLDAADAAGDRSRKIIYFILILVVLTVASIKNNYYPDWMSNRADLRHALHRCLLINDIALDGCKSIRERTEKGEKMDFSILDLVFHAKIVDRIFNHPKETKYDILGLADRMGYKLDGKFGETDFLHKNWLVISQIKRDAILFAKRDVEIQTIAIPLLGSWLDVNDLWLISGGMMMFLLYLLGASLEQEHRSIKYILDKKGAFADIVVMHQVLSILSVEMGKLGQTIECFVWLIPTALYAWLAYLDYDSAQVGIILLGDWSAVLEFVTAAFVGYFNIKCWLGHRRIRNLVRPLVPSTPPGLIPRTLRRLFCYLRSKHMEFASWLKSLRNSTSS